MTRMGRHCLRDITHLATPDVGGGIGLRQGLERAAHHLCAGCIGGTSEHVTVKAEGIRLLL